MVLPELRSASYQPKRHQAHTPTLSPLPLSINTHPTKQITLYQRLTTLGTHSCDLSTISGQQPNSRNDKLKPYFTCSARLCSSLQPHSLAHNLHNTAVAKTGHGHSVKNATWDVQAAQCAFKNLMIHEVLRFALHIAFRRVLHRCGSQDIRCWKPSIICHFKWESRAGERHPPTPLASELLNQFQHEGTGSNNNSHWLPPPTALFPPPP